MRYEEPLQPEKIRLFLKEVCVQLSSVLEDFGEMSVSFTCLLALVGIFG